MDMPKIGLGTWPMRGPDCTDVVTRAINLGYRHIDTAQMYENETEVGQGIQRADIARDQLFVTTKVNQDRFTDGTSLASARQSIDRLGVGPVDLILCHWPPQTVTTEAVVDALCDIQAAGLTRHIGVSNFNVPQTERAAARANILTNQVEFHPLLDQSRLQETARRCGLFLTAYQPILRGAALTLPVVTEISREIGGNPAAVVLRWVIQQGAVPICKSTQSDRLSGNLEALEFELSDDQMARVTALTSTNRRDSDMLGWSPDWDA